jgi:hypothetical protein
LSRYHESHASPPAAALASSPVVHIKPLDMAERDGRGYFGFGLYQDRGDGAALDVERYGKFVEANAWVASGMSREET